VNIFEQGAGILLGDEIAQSGDPPKHARDTVANAVANNIRWLALELSDGNEIAAVLLREACAASGKVVFCTWDQNLHPAQAIARAKNWNSVGHAANVESSGEDVKWTDSLLNDLVANFGSNVAVIATEGAWGRDKARASRWWNRGIIGLFEAIESENKQATIYAMADLANVLGFVHRGFVLYLNKGYPSSEYTDMINETKGVWSIFRLGDIGDDDWAEFKKWPRVTVPPILPGLGVAEAQQIIVKAVQSVNVRLEALGQPPLGELSALLNAHDSAKAALQGKWTKGIGTEMAGVRTKHGI
jgi:hypothetical protein